MRDALSTIPSNHVCYKCCLFTAYSWVIHTHTIWYVCIIYVLHIDYASLLIGSIFHDVRQYVGCVFHSQIDSWMCSKVKVQIDWYLADVFIQRDSTHNMEFRNQTWFTCLPVKSGSHCSTMSVCSRMLCNNESMGSSLPRFLYAVLAPLCSTLLAFVELPLGH